MKEMENNDFVHTLDAVYNLCLLYTSDAADD